jgi:hypothetical protein
MGAKGRQLLPSSRLHGIVQTRPRLEVCGRSIFGRPQVAHRLKCAADLGHNPLAHGKDGPEGKPWRRLVCPPAAGPGPRLRGMSRPRRGSLPKVIVDRRARPDTRPVICSPQQQRPWRRALPRRLASDEPVPPAHEGPGWHRPPRRRTGHTRLKEAFLWVATVGAADCSPLLPWGSGRNPRLSQTHSLQVAPTPSVDED